MNNKFLWVLMMIVTATGLLFAGCGNKDHYKNMRLIVEQSSIEITLEEEPDISDDDTSSSDSTENADATTENADAENKPNIAYLDAHIENKNAKQSKRILFDIVDKSIAKIDDSLTTVKDDKYKVAIRAMKAGTTYITVMSLEGNKTERVKLTVIERITAMAFDPNLSIAVAVGEKYEFNTSALNYEPVTTNQKDVTFSLENPVDGVTITPSGTLTVETQPANPHVTVVATSIANPEFTAKTDVYIYTKLQASDVHILNAVSGLEITDTLTIGKNSNYNNLNIKIAIDNAVDEYIAYSQVSDMSAINVARAQGVDNTNLEFKLTGIEQSKVKVTFNVGIVGFSAQTYISKTIDVEIVDLVETLYVNGSSTRTAVTVFDLYSTGAETMYGTKVLVEVSPSNANVKNITFSATGENATALNRFEFYTSNGQPINNILSYSMTNSGIFYIKLKQGDAFEEFNCQLVVEANKEFSEDAIVTNTLDISVKKGITKIAFEREGQSTYVDLTNDGYREMKYYVNETLVTTETINTALAGFDLTSNRIMIQKSNIISAKNDGGRLFIKPLAVGSTTLSLLSPNGMTATTTIEVVVPTDDVSVNVNPILYKNTIASVERDENNLLTKINANVNGEFMLDIEKTVANGTIWNLSFVSSNPTVALATNAGLVRTLYSGSATITVSYNYAVLDEISGNIQKVEGKQEIEIFAFKPITKFDIGKSSASVYDLNTIGYFDATQYSAVTFNVQMNECYIKKSSIRLYIYDEPFDFDSSAESYTIVGSNGTLIYDGNGVGTFYGKITSALYSAQAKIVAVVTEFDRRYTSICTVTVTKAPQTVEDISILNIDSYTQSGSTYYSMNFRAGLGLGTDTDNNKQIVASALPKNATNSKLYYFAYDDLTGKVTASTPESAIVRVTQDGVVYPLSVGTARILVVPRDELYGFDLNSDCLLSMNEVLLNLQRLQNEGSAKKVKEIIVTVSDGTINNPYQISSTADFMGIATGLNDHYVLTRSIDLSAVSLNCFGSSEQPFTGSISGRYYLVKPGLERPNGVYVDSKIFGIKLKNNDISTNESEYNYGIFGVVNGSLNEDTGAVHPSFSNLTLEFYSVDIATAQNGNSGSTTYNLGLLAGSFNGTMTNVSLAIYGNCNVEVVASNGSVNFGAFGANVSQFEYKFINQNNQEEIRSFPTVLENCKLYGSGNILLSLQTNESNIGGFVGTMQKNTQILGKYAFANDVNGESDRFIYTFNGQENDCVVALTANFLSASTTNIVGGIVGKNNGVISNVAVSGSVLAPNGTSVGGVAGVNLGSISDVYGATQVLGKTNVGGIVGLNEKTINIAVFESYEDGSSYVSGDDAVGGVVGFNKGGEITFASSTSFITSENKYAVLGKARVGGLIGASDGAKTKILRSYANTKVAIDPNSNYIEKTAGGLIGQISAGTLENTYSITEVLQTATGSVVLGGFIGGNSGSITLKTSYSVSNLSNFIGASSATIFGANNYYAGTAGNVGGAVTQKSADDLKVSTTFGLAWDFVGTYNVSADVNDGYPYLLFKNNSEFVAVVPTSLVVSVKNTVDNSFVKVDDKRALLLIQKEIGSEQKDYARFDIANLIDLAVEPHTNRVVRVKATVVEGANIIKIEGGQIVILGEGYAKIKISSQLNEMVSDEFEIYTTYGLNSFNNDANDEMKIFLDTSKEINYTFENGNNIVGQKYGIAYKNLLTYVNFNFEQVETIGSEEYHFVDYNYSKILNAKEVIENNAVIECAYVKANFGGEYVKVMLPWTEKQFNVNVYNGATNLELNKSFSSILPSQTAQVTANITTDIASEIVSKIVVKSNDEIVETYTLQILENETPSLETISIECDNEKPVLELTLIDFSFKDNQIQMTFEFAVSSDLYKIENAKTFNIDFAVADKFTKQYNLQVLPQTVERITMIHFPDGNLREDEVAIDRISSGTYGLMKINVYPNFSQVDYIDITSDAVAGENITFTQFVERGGDLIKLYPDNVQIENGIRLRLVSYRGDDGYVFDGNLYVKTLIRSNMAENLPFVVHIVAYKDGKVVYDYNKTLVTQFSPSVLIDYNEKYANQIARGTTLDVSLKLNTMAGTVTLSIEDFAGERTYVSFTATQTTFSSKFVGSIASKLFASINLDAGTTFKIRAQLDTTVENVRMTVSDERVITVVDYIITGVNIKGATTDTSGVNRLVIYLSQANNLQAELSAIYATRPSDVDANSIEGKKYAEILERMKKFEQTITKQNGKTGANVWFSGKTSGGIEGVGSFDSVGSKTDYYNYYYSTKEGCYKVYGSRISNVAIISLYVAYYFDGIGSEFAPQIVDLGGQLPQGKTIYYKQIDCVVSVENESTEEIPLPVYTTEEFLNMQEGIHYILMRDITLSAYTPMNATFASLDGNGYIVKINSFSLDSSNSTINFGLFGTISANTVIKNVVLDVNALLNGGDSTNTYDLTEKRQVNFGLFAGSNAGVITNCDVVNITELISEDGTTTAGGLNKAITVKTSLISGSNYTTNYVGLFVGQNTGYITNSRVFRTTGNIGTRENVNDKAIKNNSWTGAGADFIANGIVAGFVAYNASEISACYAKDITINNNSVIANVSYTAGFVAMNEGGYVSGSYAEGATLETADRANLKSQGSVAGFVLTNSGTVSNCYTSFVIRSPSNSAGFVNQNTNGGLIEYCYTTCEVFLAGGTVGDNASFRPFTGVNDFNEIQNAGTIVYSYYSKAMSAVVFADEPALAISEENLAKQSEYVGFAFVSNEKMRKQGIWEFDTALARPVLTTANQIAVSIRALEFDAESQEEALEQAQNGNGTLIYAYANGYDLGSEANPYLINTAEKFNNLFKGISTFGTNIVSTSETADGKIPETKFIRIVSDLNFAATSETVDGLNSSKVEFRAILDGNNMLLNGISLVGEKTTGQTEFGLFERLNGAVIKNARMQFNEVSATEIPVVGALCGMATDSIILGVKIVGEGKFVQGKNVVGGLVGIAIGNCEIQTIESNVSVHATYRKGSGATLFTDLVYEKVGDTTTVGVESASYAGGLIGATLASEGNNMVVRTLKVSGAVSIGAERTGGIVAVNYAKLYDLNFVTQITSGNAKQELSGDDVIGGIVGINFGSIDKARLTYEGDDLVLVDKLSEGVSGGKTNLFIGTSNYIGGLVGKNIDGKIVDSYNRVNVTNKNAEYAGAISGYVKGGEFSSIYTTSSVSAKTAFGSAFGYLDKNVVTTKINNIEKEITKTISAFNNIVLMNNYTTTIAQSVRGGAKAGVIAGFVNADVITDVFESISISSNYAVSNLPLNLSGTSYQKLQYFGSAKFDKMQIDEDEYKTRLANLNEFKYVAKDGTEMKFSWFNTTDDFVNASYSSLFKNRHSAFVTYDDNNWTKEASTFPLLKITTQATEIVITDENKEQLLSLIENNPNATFVIKCDLKLYTKANLGDIDGDWTPLGSKISPFSGKFLGQQITALDENGKRVERLPIVEIKETLIDYCRSATVSNLTFKVSLQNNEDEYNAQIDDYYFGSIANYAENSSFSGLTIKEFTPISVSGERSYNPDEKVPTNYIGGMLGYASSCTVSNIDFETSMNVELQTETDTVIASNVGGLVGYSLLCDIMDVNYKVAYTQYSDGRAYNSFRVTSGNANVGAIVGNAGSSRIKVISLTESKSRDIDSARPQDSSTTPIVVNCLARDSRATTNFGSIAGVLNSSNITNAENALSGISIVANVKSVKTIIAGGIVGDVFTSTMTSVENSAKISISNQTLNDTLENQFKLAGIAGRVRGEVSISNAQNRGQVNVSGTTMTQTTGYVGGLVGEVVCGTMVARISASRNLANISATKLYNANVGGIVGRVAIDVDNADNLGNCRIIETYNECSVTTESDCANEEISGGLIGFANRLNVNNSYSVGRVISKTLSADSQISVGGFIGRLHQAGVQPTLSYCYSVVVVKALADPIKNKVYSKEFVGYTSLTSQNVNTVVFGSCYYAGELAQSNDSLREGYTQNMHDYTANFVSYGAMLNATTFKNFSISTNAGDTSKAFVMTNGKTLPMLSKFFDTTASSVGTVYQPTQIATADDLERFTASVETGEGNYYLQVASIVTSNTQTRSEFAGVFDGGNYTISGLTKPLFGTIASDAVVASVNIQALAINAQVSGDYGAIAKTNRGTILFSSADGEINFTSSLAGSTFGGIVGKNYGHIGFTSSNVSVGQTDNSTGRNISVGGIAGEMNKQVGGDFAQISNCFATGTLRLSQVTGENLCVVGGIVGNLLAGNLQLCYSASRIDYLNATNVKAYGAVFSNDNGGDQANNVYDEVRVSNVYNDKLATLLTTVETSVGDISLQNIMQSGLPKGFDSFAWSSFAIDYSQNSKAVMLNYGYPYLKYASQSVSQIASKGTGSTDRPYLIKNQSSFEIINAMVAKSMAYTYKLDGDIYCTDGDYISSFIGTLDGGNKTIYNMSMTISGGSENGFVSANRGTISNITFANSSAKIRSNHNGRAFGLVVGTNSGKISNVRVERATVSYERTSSAGSQSEEMSIGGFVGENSGQITGSSVSNLQMTLRNSHYTGVANLGGFVGKNSNKGTIGTDSSNIDCSVKNLTINAGGSTKIASSVYKRVGGFVGYVAGGTITRCAVEGGTASQIQLQAQGENNNFGGFAGQNGSASEANKKLVTIIECKAYIDLVANVDNGATLNIGGICGYTQWFIRNPVVTASMTVTGDTSNVNQDTFVGSAGGATGLVIGGTAE